MNETTINDGRADRLPYVRPQLMMIGSNDAEVKTVFTTNEGISPAYSATAATMPS